MCAWAGQPGRREGRWKSRQVRKARDESDGGDKVVGFGVELNQPRCANAVMLADGSEVGAIVATITDGYFVAGGSLGLSLRGGGNQRMEGLQQIIKAVD